MARRLEVVTALREHGNNGGIKVAPGELKAARADFATAAIVFNEANTRLVEAVHPRHYSVVVWGSTRLHENTPEHQFVANLTQALVERTGCDIITGGGPGIMEAAPRGALRARQSAEDGSPAMKARTHGATIVLPFEEKPNPFLDGHTVHDGFPTRLQEFMSSANAVYVAPGGIGSLLELMLPLQEKQVRRVEEDFPLIVHPMYRKILEAVNETFYHDRIDRGQIPTINEGDVFNNVVISDDVPLIVGIIEESHSRWKKGLRDRVKKEEQGKLF